MAYYPNGDIYTCDEARSVGQKWEIMHLKWGMLQLQPTKI